MKKEIIYNNERYLIDVSPSAYRRDYAFLCISKREKFLVFGYWSKIIEHIISIKAVNKNLDEIVTGMIQHFERTKVEEEENMEQLEKWFK